MSEIIKGSLLAKKILEKTAIRIKKLPILPGLGVILVGSDPASKLYVSLKEKAAKEAGIYVDKQLFPEDASTEDIKKAVQNFNKRDDIHGILVQFPLSGQDENAIISTIDPKKDVDGFHPINRGGLLNGAPAFVPPVALAVMKLVTATRQPLKSKRAAIIANSGIFGEPIVHLLAGLGTASEIINPDDAELIQKTKEADIIIVAVGRAGVLTKQMTKNGAIVIDVGTNKNGRRTIGDAAPDVIENAAFISPVPGGVGPLTVAYLLSNVLKAAQAIASR